MKVLDRTILAAFEEAAGPPTLRPLQAAPWRLLNHRRGLVLMVLLAGLALAAVGAARSARASAEPPTVVRIATSVAADRLPPKKVTRLGLYLTALEAAAALSRDKSVLLIDVRSETEVEWLGMAVPVDRNIPFMQYEQVERPEPGKPRYRLMHNADFVAAVTRLVSERGLTQGVALLLLCRSGDRSAQAADRLALAGFPNVYSIVDGYEGDLQASGRRDANGWKNSGLPWSLTPGLEQLYRPPQN